MEFNNSWKRLSNSETIGNHHSNPSLQRTLSLPLNGHGMTVRETGVVEKLLTSYGFVRCIEREGRLFFHYSQYSGNAAAELRVGDCLEFEMVTDRKTGKPIASKLFKIPTNMGMSDVPIEEPVEGVVMKVASTNIVGQLTYELSGESFFLGYTISEAEDLLGKDDKVMFIVSTDQRNSVVSAKKIRRVKPDYVVQCQGVVRSMKESFGFIERADAVKEIFFHYSEFQGTITDLSVSDEVQFEIGHRQDKQVATNIIKLPEGTVVFEDVGEEELTGRVFKVISRTSSRKSMEAFPGKLEYEKEEGKKMELSYSEKDLTRTHTFQMNDLVRFQLVTDRRDKSQRATAISLQVQSFATNDEIRETGTVAAVKDGFGFIKCAEREARMFFHFSEMLEDGDIHISDDVEFTVIQDPTAPQRQISVRIKPLPKGSVKFEIVHPQRLSGRVEKVPPNMWGRSPGGNRAREQSYGNITYSHDGEKKSIMYHAKDIDMRIPPDEGDEVEFNIAEVKRDKTMTAVNIVVQDKTYDPCKRGYIAVLKDHFGFLENEEHEREVFFHYSEFQGDPNDLEIGDEVEFTHVRKGSKASGERIKKLPKGTIPVEKIKPGTFQGQVLRPLRCIDPQQTEYTGLVQVTSEDEFPGPKYPYCILSLADKHEFLQMGDPVSFQLAVSPSTGKTWAWAVAGVRKFIRARISSIKGQYGFIDYDTNEGKKLFFHLSEVTDGGEVAPGHEVEFVLVQNQKTGRYSAVNVRRLTDAQRPQHLHHRLKKPQGDSMSPKLIILRQPRGPDGSKGFASRH